MCDVAAVIVTWNVRDLVIQAIQTLKDDLDASGLRYEIYVVDSASSDRSAQAIQAAFPDIQLIASDENLGFSRANNVALREMGFGSVAPARLPRAVYLINPDTITHAGATQTLYDALFARESVGLVGARLTYEDGAFQHSAFAFPGIKQLWVELFPIPGRFVESAFNGRYSRALYDARAPFPVDFTLGATMMLKRDVILATGGFDDEAFFMYCEEIDWAWRIQRAGWAALCVPEAHVTHLADRSASQMRPLSVQRLWTSRLRLYKKYYPWWKNWIARQMVAIGMRRMISRARRNQESEELINAYRKIQAEARQS